MMRLAGRRRWRDRGHDRRAVIDRLWHGHGNPRNSVGSAAQFAGCGWCGKRGGSIPRCLVAAEATCFCLCRSRNDGAHPMVIEKRCTAGFPAAIG